MRYFQLFIAFFKASLISDMEYRVNMLAKVATDIIWYAAQLAIFEVLFRHARTLSGWNLDSTRTFMGVLFLVDSVWMFLFSENLDRLTSKVRNGDLDFLLVKPINAQFMISLQKLNTAYLGNVALTFGFLLWAAHRLPGGFDFTRLLWLLYAVPWSLLLVYAIRFFFSSLSVIFINAESINYIWYQLYRMGTRPDSIYPPWLRYILLSFIPVGFIASVPTRLMLGTDEPWMIFALPGLAVCLFWLTCKFWQRTIRSYTSASS